MICRDMNLDSIAVSLFVDILVEFDIFDKYSEANPNNNLMIGRAGLTCCCHRSHLGRESGLKLFHRPSVSGSEEGTNLFFALSPFHQVDQADGRRVHEVSIKVNPTKGEDL